MRLNQRMNYANALRSGASTSSSGAASPPVGATAKSACRHVQPGARQESRTPKETQATRLLFSSLRASQPESKSFPTPARKESLDRAFSLASASQSEGVLHRVQRWEGSRLEMQALDGALRLPLAKRARQALYDLQPGMQPASLSNGPVVYIDGETTGLGGASNRFCVIGIVYASAQAWICEQWVLAKLSYEEDFFRAITKRLDALDPCAIVSFNGASFDLPLFRKRLAAQKDSQLANWDGLEPQRRPLLDLVHSARRVWKGRVPDCRLQSLERHFLGVRRLDDLPGREVPKVYWAWLRRRRAAQEAQRMEQVLLHNLVDLAVMPALAHRIAEKLSDPQDGEDALRALCHSERAPSHPMFSRAMRRWLAAGQPGAWALAEARIQIWIRALEGVQEAEGVASAPLHALLSLAQRRFEASKWVFRRCVRWGLVAKPVSSVEQLRSGSRAQLSLGWGV